MSSCTGSNNGQLAKIESTVGTAKQWEQRFGYDSIGRLSEAREHRGDTNALSYKQKFDYDRFGNLYRKASSNPTTGQATPIAFAPIEDADISKTTNRFSSGTTYDDAGNVTQDAKFRLLNYSYDANGRMYKTATISPPNQSNAVYDSAGQRVATQVDGVWTFFIYNGGGKKVAEYGGLQATDEGGVKYVLQDYQGSTRAIVSNSGYINARMDYTAFGEEIQSNIGQRTAQGYAASNTLDQKYALTERDKATGLDHTWFRKLENQAGRWTSPDPFNGSMSLGNPQSFNRYSYVGNEPTNFVDPSGLLMSAGGGMCFTVWRDWFADGVYFRTEYVGSFCIGGGGGSSSGGGSSGGFSFGGGGGGISPSADEKQYINCMKAVDKKYSNLEEPSKWADYSLDKKQLIELFNQKYSQNWSLSSIDIGVLIILAKVGGKGGVLLGLLGKAAVTIYKDGQIHDEWMLRAKHLAEKNPNEAEYDKQSAFKQAEQIECEKYLPQDERTRN